MESQECCFQRNHLMMRILLGHSHTGRTPSYSTTNLHHIWVHTYVMSYEFYIRWKVSSWGCAACQNKGKVGGICAICISHRGEGLTTGQEKQNRGKISARQALLHFGAQTDTSSAPKILALRHFWCTDRYSVHQVHQNICLAQCKYQKYQQISQLTKVAICCQKFLFIAKSCQKLPFVAKGYYLLPKVAKVAKSSQKLLFLPKVAKPYRLLPKVATGTKCHHWDKMSRLWTPKTTFKTDFKSDILSRDNLRPGTICRETKCRQTTFEQWTTFSAKESFHNVNFFQIQVKTV